MSRCGSTSSSGIELFARLSRVARPNIEEESSPYYPPRARWYGRLFSPWFKLRRALHLEKIHLPDGFTAQQTIVSLLVPGYAFFANGRSALGWLFAGIYAGAAALFIVALGYQLGSLGFGLMISAHASSIIFLEGCWLRGLTPFGFRLALAGATLLVVWLGVYAPLTRFAEAHFIMPLRVRGNVVVMQRVSTPRSIRSGDWVMYSLPSRSLGAAHREGGAVWIQAGLGWGPVLAVAGDRVVFSTNSFAVNGVAQPLRPHMPTSGGLVVPEKHWFVWPKFDINRHGNVSEANLSAIMLQLATVSEIEFIGKPFKHWFWRRQITL